MKRYLIDTNIIRFYIEGIPEVIKFWEECEANEGTLLLSMVTVGELRSQMIEVHQKHKSALRTLIKSFPTIEVMDSADRKAHAYKKMARCIRSMHEQEKKPFQPKLPELADAKGGVFSFLQVHWKHYIHQFLVKKYRQLLEIIKQN